MAIGITEPIGELNTTVDATSYALVAFTPAADATLIAWVVLDSSAAVGTMSGGGLTWSLVGSIAYNTSDKIYLFWANTGAAPGSNTVTFDCSDDGGTGCIMGIWQFTGSDVLTANPIKQFKAGAATSANPSVTFDAAMATLNGYAVAAGIPRNPPTSAPPASWTETFDNGQSGGHGATAAYRAGGETGSTVTLTSASAAWGMIAVEVYVSGAGPRKALPPQSPVNWSMMLNQ